MTTVMINDDNNNKKWQKKEKGVHCVLLISDKW